VSEEVLFIGGTADGSRGIIDDNVNVWTVCNPCERPSVRWWNGDLPDLQSRQSVLSYYRRFWITRTVSVFLEVSIDGDEVIGRLVEGYGKSRCVVSGESEQAVQQNQGVVSNDKPE
jgi:hypothetical protein